MNSQKDWTRKELEEHYVGKMKAITITADITIAGKQRILDLREVTEILRNARRISQNECYCRKKVGNCIEPMNGCIGLDEEAELDIENGNKEITVDEALEALARFGFGADQHQLLVVTVLAALPSAQNINTYAALYQRGDRLARDTTLVSTLLSVPVSNTTTMMTG